MLELMYRVVHKESMCTAYYNPARRSMCTLGRVLSRLGRQQVVGNSTVGVEKALPSSHVRSSLILDEQFVTRHSGSQCQSDRLRAWTE